VAATPTSLTGQYLAAHLRIAVPRAHAARSRCMAAPPSTRPCSGLLRIVGARGNNLKGVTVEFPVGLLTCVTGVSGSGKSTLVNDTLYAAVARKLYQAHAEPAPHDGIDGLDACSTR
jgi:excinuclease ABC subunit A